MGISKRPLYKPERRPARFKGVLGHDQAPVGCPDATALEISTALFSICDTAHVTVGRGGNYDPIKDLYTVVGKSKITGKAQDFVVEGIHVAALIQLVREVNGVPVFDPRRLTKGLSKAG